jgi:hypothetical protein
MMWQAYLWQAYLRQAGMWQAYLRQASGRGNKRAIGHGLSDQMNNHK